MLSKQQVVVVVVVVIISSLESENSFKQMWLKIVKQFLMYLFNGQTNKENSVLGRVDSKPIVHPPSHSSNMVLAD